MFSITFVCVCDSRSLWQFRAYKKSRSSNYTQIETDFVKIPRLELSAMERDVLERASLVSMPGKKYLNLL